MDERDIDRLRDVYLDKYIFCGLSNLNTGFDVPTIKYFSREHFEIVLDRCERDCIGIYGIEPWQDGEFYDVTTCEESGFEPTDPQWYRKAFNVFTARGAELQYAASYYVPARLLNLPEE